MESERIPFAFGKGSPLVQPGIIKQIISGQPGFIYSATLALYFLVGGIHGIFFYSWFGKVMFFTPAATRMSTSTSATFLAVMVFIKSCRLLQWVDMVKEEPKSDCTTTRAEIGAH